MWSIEKSFSKVQWGQGCMWPLICLTLSDLFVWVGQESFLSRQSSSTQYLQVHCILCYSHRSAGKGLQLLTEVPLSGGYSFYPIAVAARNEAYSAQLWVTTLSYVSPTYCTPHITMGGLGRGNALLWVATLWAVTFIYVSKLLDWSCLCLESLRVSGMLPCSWIILLWTSWCEGSC